MGERIDSDHIAQVRRERLLREIESAHRIQEQGLDPLALVDRMVHDLIEIASTSPTGERISPEEMRAKFHQQAEIELVSKNQRRNHHYGRTADSADSNG
jgi:hypothetical protein